MDMKFSSGSLIELTEYTPSCAPAACSADCSLPAIVTNVDILFKENKTKMEVGMSPEYVERFGGMSVFCGNLDPQKAWLLYRRID